MSDCHGPTRPSSVLMVRTLLWKPSDRLSDSRKRRVPTAKPAVLRTGAA